MPPDVFTTATRPSASSSSRSSIATRQQSSTSAGATGIEVEHDRARPVHVGRAVHWLRVQLERGEVGEPHERREVFDDAAALAAVGLERLGRVHPAGWWRRAALLEEPLAGGAVGRPHERGRPPGEVGEHHRRDLPVVVDHVGFAESRRGVQQLVEVGERELAALDLDRLTASG